MEFITSDLHFGHHNICGPEGFCSTRRHFSDAEEMNQTIIENWNKVVKKDSVVYVLGDISMNMKPRDLVELVSQLKGQLYFVKGNHDSSRILNALNKEDRFSIIPMGAIIKRNGIQYYLTHYPLGLGEGRRGIRNLCGHIHEQTAYDSNVLNVGIDSPEIDDVPFGTPIELSRAMHLVDMKHKKYIDNLENK